MATRSATSNAPQNDTAATPEDENTVPETSNGRGQNAQRFDNDALRAITSFDEALALTEQTLGHEVVNASDEMGNGFTILPTTDKDKLVGVRFLIMSFDFHAGDNGTYVSCQIVTEDGRRLVLNDGSTGICDQLITWNQKTNRSGGLLVNGVRRSEYDRKNEHGDVIVNPNTGRAERGVTFYLNV